MQRTRILGSLLVLALACFAWSVRRGGSSVVALHPSEDRAATPSNDGFEARPLPAPRKATVAAPGTSESSPDRASGRREAETQRVHGTLRDRHTGKPIPEARIALRRGTETEIVVTDSNGVFRSDRAWGAGALVIDPTPFENDRRDWYSQATGEPVEVQLRDGHDDPLELVVDAPAFVVVQGAPRIETHKSRLRARLLLPGSEFPGWDGTTWVSAQLQHEIQRAKRLSDGGVIIACDSFESSPFFQPRAGEHGTARIEISGEWSEIEWYSSGPLDVRGGRFQDERVPVHERTSCGSFIVSARDSDGERVALDGNSVRLRASTMLPRPELPASHRPHADWARRFDVAPGQEVAHISGRQNIVWRSGGLPVATYEVEIRHPQFDVATRRVAVVAGAETFVRFRLNRTATGPPLRMNLSWMTEDAPRPSLHWKLTRLTAQGERFDRFGSARHLGPNGSGTLTASLSTALLEDLPRASYAVDLEVRSVGEVPCFPVLIEPDEPILDASRSLEIVVHNESLQPWSIEVSLELLPPEERNGSRRVWLELFEPDGTSLGGTQCFLEDGAASCYAPVAGAARYALTELGVASAGRTFRGAWRADRTDRVGGETRRVLVVR